MRFSFPATQYIDTVFTYILSLLQVISGQHLPKPLKGSATGEIIDPYVRLEVKGLPCDTKDYKTKYISDNGINCNRAI